jgi:hypothetical protein
LTVFDVLSLLKVKVAAANSQSVYDGAMLDRLGGLMLLNELRADLPQFKKKGANMVYLPRVALIFVAAMLGLGNAMAVEEADYMVELKEQPFELRRYEPHLIAETLVGGEFDEAGSKAFRRLFKYISGNNQSREEVKMTAPVGQGAASEKIDMTSPVGQQRQNDQWAVSFMMPAGYSLETLPEPQDPLVVLRQVPARHIAAIRYSGFWSEKTYLLNKAKLDVWIEEKGLTVAGKAIWARYNAPFTPWFMRRNEVLVPVVRPSEND